MALDPAILERAREWTGVDYDPDTRREVQALLDAAGDGAEEELRNRFGAHLEFGTGGMRGIVGAGTNRMNRYTAGAASQGLARCIRKQVSDPRRASVVIAHDSRTHSAQFAGEAATIFAGNGIKTYLFEALRPTPLLSFAVRHLRATAGVVITASHNPMQYNGYKVYWSDGAQIVPPHDRAIIEEVRAISSVDQIRFTDSEQAKHEGLIVLIGEEIDEAYLEAIEACRLATDLAPSHFASLEIVYSALHGTGATLVPEALKRWGFPRVSSVEAQAIPDGTFPTAPKPNPEEQAAMQMALDQAAGEGADLVMATDPDADRIGIAAPDAAGRWVLLTGNQTASLITEWLCGRLREQGRLPADGAVVKTIVTTELIAAIAQSHGVAVENVLTGFKWIGAKIRGWEEARAAGRASRTFLFGGEESYGYLVGTHARDKDAVVCACVIAEMAAWAKSQGWTLLDLLDQLFELHGVHLESLVSLERQGLAGMSEIQAMMARLRGDPPLTIAGVPVETLMDCEDRTRRRLDDSSTTVESIDLPRSNVLHFTLRGGGKAVARPSGTEPKIKFYFGATESMLSDSDRALPLAERRSKVEDLLSELEKDFLERVS
jgi:phosphoglucomutase